MSDFSVLLSLFPAFMVLSKKTQNSTQLNTLDISKVSAVIVYNDAETDKSKILSDNKGLSRIYQWKHLETGKVYIGSAVDLSNRLESYYFFSLLKRADNYISRGLFHHEYSAFSLTILEYINITNLNTEEARNLILEREQFYLDLIFKVNKPNTYNILKIAGSPLGYKHTEEDLTKFSGENHPLFGKYRLPETRAKISKAITGKIHTAKTKALISKVHKGKLISAETKALMSLAKNKIIFV